MKRLASVVLLVAACGGSGGETLAGHADLMSFYQMAAVHEMAKEFE